ncbi:HAMP domain-containing histidine kinase [Streptomyces sp. NBC_01476]|uniref:sensor histidine kinase n=1 Tax=Streptomyces sp. NBC_01476 TaxID=2903881 RepID=UPI002E33CF60|nr:HAMP domain-containing sensor histidine kinase [Streptomyces sp. NBC_01476]
MTGAVRGRLFGSVRARTTLAATVVVAIALAAAAVAVLAALRSNLTGQADRAADSTARDVALHIIADVPAPTSYPDLRLPDASDHPVQVITPDGTLLAAGKGLTRVTGKGMGPVTAPVAPPAAKSPAPSASSVPAPSPALFDDGGRGRSGGPGDDDNSATAGPRADDHRGQDGGDESGGGHDDATTAPPALGSVGDVLSHTTARVTVDGRTGDYRFVTIEVTDQAKRKVVVRAGASLAARQSAVRTATAAMLTGLPLLLLVVGGVTWLVTRRALTPVEGIRREMAAITASGDLSRRVPQPRSRDEVARLARTTNETLTSLEAAVDRQRRFVADASHELRSPIASLRTQLEVGSAHPHLLDVPGAVEDAVRLQRLAADLLLLARLDAGEQPQPAEVDLAALVAEEIAERTDDRLRIVPGAPGDGRGLVMGSRVQLSRVFGNLLDNAQRHARSAVAVSLTYDAGAGEVVLAVQDDGAGVPAAERERIFERFVRLDEARSSDDGGAGLGLAIARDVAERHGGRLILAPAAHGGARFELRLPPLP